MYSAKVNIDRCFTEEGFGNIYCYTQKHNDDI